MLGRSGLMASSVSHLQRQHQQQYNQSAFLPGRFGQPAKDSDSSDGQHQQAFSVLSDLQLRRQTSDETVRTSSSSASLPSSPVVSKNNFLSDTCEDNLLVRASSLEEVSPFAQSINPDAHAAGGHHSGPGGSVISLMKPVTSGELGSDGDQSAPLPFQPPRSEECRDTTRGRPSNFAPTPNRRVRGQQSSHSPPRIEMSALHQHRSRSLLHDSSAAGGSSSRYFPSSVTSSRNDLPSVLLSVLRAENIDYENDFYWLAKFNHERRHNPQLLEQSLMRHSMAQQQEGDSFSPVMRSSVGVDMGDIYGTASASGVFMGSNSLVVDAHGDASAAQPRQHQQQYGDPFSPPGRRSALQWAAW